MWKTNSAITINDRIKSFDDLLKRYKTMVLKGGFDPSSDIDDLGVNLYFKKCIKDNMPVEEFINKKAGLLLDMSPAYQSSKNTEEFVKKVNIIAKQEEEKYNKKIEENTNLTLRILLNKYSQENIKEILPYLNFIQSKNFSKLNVVVIQPEKGFDKEDLDSLLTLADIVDQDLIIQESQYVGKNELTGEKGFEPEVTLNQTIKAYSTMEQEVDKINKLGLSPFEKFLYIHDFAANKIYNEEKGWDPSLSRSFVNAMTNDTIVCAGYANIMKAFCEKVGIECYYIAGYPESESGNEFENWNSLHEIPTGHAANIVYLKDEKYNIDGYYFCDSCWDSKKNEDQYGKKYTYAALPIQDIKYAGQGNYFKDELLENLNIPKHSKPITLNNFNDALNNIYNDHQLVKLSLNRCVWSADLNFDKKAQNCFNTEQIRRHSEQIL